MELPQALAAVVRHLLLPGRGELLRAAGEPRADAAGLGLAVRLRRRHRRSTSAPSTPGSCRRPTGAAVPTAARHAPATSTGSGSPATRCSSRSARATCSVTPIQMARFYAMIANGGELVTPHLAEDVETPGERRGRRRRSCATSRPSSRRRAGSTRRLPAGGAAGALRRDALDPTAPPTGSSASSRSRSRARPARPQKDVTIPGYPNPLELNQSWWCGYGPFNDAHDRRLRGDRERRPRRHRGRARRAPGLRGLLPQARHR